VSNQANRTLIPGFVLIAPKELVMETISRITLGALLAACCASTAFAQTSQGSCNPYAPKTRAEVKADYIQWRAAGYDPQDWINYPYNAQQAGRIVAQRRAMAGIPAGCVQ
jgi:hypothetical protein